MVDPKEKEALKAFLEDFGRDVDNIPIEIQEHINDNFFDLLDNAEET